MKENTEKISECPNCKVRTKGTVVSNCKNCGKTCCENCGKADGECDVCGHQVDFVGVMA